MSSRKGVDGGGGGDGVNGIKKIALLVEPSTFAVMVSWADVNEESSMASWAQRASQGTV